jgi:hypothetical protein
MKKLITTLFLLFAMYMLQAKDNVEKISITVNSTLNARSKVEVT